MAGSVLSIVYIYIYLILFNPYYDSTIKKSLIFKII